jgi:protein-S-isoprenylcysteine O-methyltransferase Ste14
MNVSTSSENAGVIARPPVLYTLAFLAGMALELVFPTSFVPGLTGPALGLAFVLGGFGLMAMAMRYFRLAGTPIETYLPSTELVTAGPYQLSRNPIYVALTLIYVGLAFVFDALWPLAVLPLLLVLMHFGVVRREEAYLEAKFGDAYHAYRARVRRWV